MKTPEDLESLRERLARPDFVLRSGPEYMKLLKELEDARAQMRGEAPPWVIDGIQLEGEIRGNLAWLKVTYRITLSSELKGPTRVPIRLDGLTLSGAREQSEQGPARDVAVSSTRVRTREAAADVGWEVELMGGGRHGVEVELLVPVRPTADGRKLELPIPEAASTRVNLSVDLPVIDAVANGKDPLTVTPGLRGLPSRVTADLTPRPRLELSWRVREPSGPELPPLILARTSIAAVIDADVFRAQTSFEVRCERGGANQLEIEIDPNDEISSLELDGQTLTADVRRSGASSVLTVPMTPPLRANEPRRLVLSTRRSLRAAEAEPAVGSSPMRWTFKGFPMPRAASQSGLLAIAHGADLWVSGTPGRGARQIDPRTELPDDLRDRPSTMLAYQLVQPFALDLRAEPAPPRVQVSTWSEVTLTSTESRVETTLTYEVTRGRKFELQVDVPRGLEFESAGPEDLVEAALWKEETAALRGGTGGPGSATEKGVGAASPPRAEESRRLVLRLLPKAREGRSITVVLRGRQSLGSAPAGGGSRLVVLAMFEPRDAEWQGGSIQIRAVRQLGVEWPDRPSGFEFDRLAIGAGTRGFASSGLGTSGVAAGPGGAGGLAAVAAGGLGESPIVLRLRHEGRPGAPRLLLTERERRIFQETSLRAVIDPRGREVRQETLCRVEHGTAERLDLAVPEELDGLWEVEGPEVAGRAFVRVEPSGERIYRLSLTRDVGEGLRLKFRYVRPWPSELRAGQEYQASFPWLRLVDAESTGVRLTVVAERGMILSVKRESTNRWVVLPELGDDASVPPSTSWEDVDFPPRLSLVHPAESPGERASPVVLLARVERLATMPGLLASRLWLRSMVTTAGDIRHAAVYSVDSHGAALVVRLPAAARWLGAKVDGRTLENVEAQGGDVYALRLAGLSGSVPVVVRLEYLVPRDAAAGQRGMVPPRLLDGVVQQTAWEVRLPWSRAALGNPSGWLDDNTWYWDQYVWKRRPARGEAELAAWIGEAPTIGGAVGSTAAIEANSGMHAYLFTLAGDPEILVLPIVSRAGLVAVCSGLVLLCGLIGLGLPPARGLLLMGLTALGLLMAALDLASFLVLVQSAMIGVLLTVLAWGAQGWLNHRGRNRSRSGRSRMGASGWLGGDAGVGMAGPMAQPILGSTPALAARDPVAMAVGVGGQRDWVIIPGPAAVGEPEIGLGGSALMPGEVVGGSAPVPSTIDHRPAFPSMPIDAEPTLGAAPAGSISAPVPVPPVRRSTQDPRALDSGELRLPQSGGSSSRVILGS